MGKIKLDNTLTSSRPDLKVKIPSRPGAYIIRNGVPVPDLNDEAMKTREERRLKKEAPEPVKPETKQEEKEENGNTL